MFGKKKPKAESAEVTVVKPAAPTKAKKQAKLRGKGEPNFFAAHIEKIALALFVGLAGYFIYSGISTPGYPTNRAPDSLKEDARRVLNQVVSEDHWPAIAPDRAVETNFEQAAMLARRPTNPDDYSFGTLDPTGQGALRKRTDPVIFAPEKLVVKAVVGSMAIQIPNETPDPFENFENADKVEVRRRQSNNNNRQNNLYGDTGSTPGTGMRPMGPGESDENAAPRIRVMNSKYNLGVPVGMSGGGMEGSGMMGSGMMGSGMMGSGMMGSGSGGAMGPGSGGAMMGPGAGGGGGGGGLGGTRANAPKEKVSSQPVIFVAGTALVAHKKMVEEFDRVFQDTGPYIVERDRPVYLSFEVQRVEVTQDPGREIKEEEWQTVTDGTRQFALRKTWARPPLAPAAQEVIDRNAFHGGLTMPIPPLLIRNYREFSKHPNVAWSWDAKPLVQRPQTVKPKEEDDDNVLPGERNNQPSGGMGDGMGMGMGMEGMGMEGSGMEGYGMGMEGYGMEGSGMGMEGGMMGGYGMEGSGGGYGVSSGPPTGPVPEYKMIRFFDMLKGEHLGKVFRYRVRLVMRDPNYPERSPQNPELDRFPAPSPSSLEQAVFTRVSELRRKDDAAFANDKKARRTMRNTDWSEASPAVQIQGKYEVFAGVGVETGPSPKRPVSAVEQGPGELVANLVATKMIGVGGARFASTFSDVRRGAMLNHPVVANKKVTYEFVVPTTKVIKKAEDLPLAIGSTVVDIRGGDELAASDKRNDPLYSSGEVMVLMQDGSVQFTNDLDDTFYYRMYTFADEKEEANNAGSSTPGAGSGSGSGYGSEGASPP